MRLRRSSRLSSILALTALSLAILGVGTAMSVAARTHAAPMTSVTPQEASPPKASPSPSATAPQPTVTEDQKAILLAPGGRSSTFSNEIQTNLLTIAETHTINGVEMTVSDFYLYQGHLFVSVCFATRGLEGWQMGPATLSFANGQINWFSVHPTLDQLGSSEGQPGRHCETLEFDMLPAGAELSDLSLRVESVLLAPPREFHECETYIARWARSQRMEQLGIVADCNNVPGSTQVTIKAKPEGMTEEEAQAIAGQEAAGMVLGPWEFTRSRLDVVN
jgi:hypothetical protein